ncbi:ATP-binding cassette domain-containing protein [Nonomuraea recticatena]|uniref:ATP-binding cassette domain-containing protein n=1 Tax=Nonomuraea recticatena TaxID=46178 RepID=UPI00360A4603
MKNHVEARNIVKRFGPTVALNGAGISIKEGDTHALVGRNGAGKSTLVSILTGLQRPDEGEVLFSGEAAPPLADRDAWRRRVACVYQKSTIIPELSVAENLFLNRQTAGGRSSGRRCAPAPARCSRPTRSTSTPTCSPATSASSSASSSRSPAPSPSARRSSSWTSPPPSSTAPPSSGSSSGCARCASRASR